jgi:hypothetical protein
MAGALCAGAAMAADTAGKQPQQEAAGQGKDSAALGNDSDACPAHGNKTATQKNVLGKDGEHCACPHDKMHTHHMQHTGKHDALHGAKHEACDPAKEAAKPLKPVS